MTICLNSINFIWIFLASVIISYIIYIKTKNNYTFILICSLTLYIVFFICITIFPITILSRSDLNQLYSQYGKYIKYYQLIPFKTILGVVIGYLIYLLINRISITNKIFKRLVYEK